jgi:holliday junction DNA helicase RuvA
LISYIKGIILQKKAPFLLIDVQDIGHELQAPMTTFYHLPEVGQPVALWTHLAVREDAWNLYGFNQEKDRDLFRILIKVNGIGAKVALSLLSGMEPAQLLQCIAQERVSDLTSIPGIGKKTAERLILETRTALSQWDLAPSSTPTASSNKEDALSALAALGYKPADAKKALANIPDDITTTEKMIRHALQRIGKGAAHA